MGQLEPRAQTESFPEAEPVEGAERAVVEVAPGRLEALEPRAEQAVLAAMV